jgi:hypothetical protein
MTGNDFVKFFLRTPLRVFLGDTMLITVTGLKTGKKYSTPVGFYRENGNLWVLTNRSSTWWRNVKNGADVSLVLEGKPIQAFAQAELDTRSVETHLVEYVQHVPIAARSLGIRVENKVPDRGDIARIAKDRLFVKIQPA